MLVNQKVNNMDIIRVILMGIPLFIGLVFGLGMMGNKTKITDKIPPQIVMAICTNQIAGAIIIAGVLIAAYI